MKISPALLVALAAMLLGCSDSSNMSSVVSTNAPAGGNVLTAPVDYLKSAADAHHSAVKTLDVTSLKKAIEMFNVQEGRFPKELNELVTGKYIPEIPVPPAVSKIEYNASAGTGKVVKQ